MGPNGSRKPIGKLAQRIDEVFGSFDKFKWSFLIPLLIGLVVVGLGWCWINMYLSIISTKSR